jgi:hypothetical protein
MSVSIWLFGGNDALELHYWNVFNINWINALFSYKWIVHICRLWARQKLKNEILWSRLWLTQEEMALLFNSDRTRITRHINNILKDGELEEKSNVRKTHFPHSNRPIKMFSQIYRQRFWDRCSNRCRQRDHLVNTGWDSAFVRFCKKHNHLSHQQHFFKRRARQKYFGRKIRRKGRTW